MQILLDECSEVTLWKNGVFGLSKSNLESLENSLDCFDCAVLILTPDDIITSRGRTQVAARDNLLIEIGLFVGKLGRDRTFIVQNRTADLKIPSDILGITVATYELHSSGNAESTLGAAASKIETEVARLGVRNVGQVGTARYASQLDSLGTKVEELRLQTHSANKSSGFHEVDEQYRELALEFFNSLPLRKAEEHARTAQQELEQIQKTHALKAIFDGVKSEIKKLASAYNCHDTEYFKVTAETLPVNIYNIDNHNCNGNRAYVLLSFKSGVFWCSRITFQNKIPAVQVIRLLSASKSSNFDGMMVTNDSINFVLGGDEFYVSYNVHISQEVRRCVAPGVAATSQPMAGLISQVTDVVRRVIEYELLHI